MASAYCTKGKEILQDLQRSELLSVYDDEAIRLITNGTIRVIHMIINTLRYLFIGLCHLTDRSTPSCAEMGDMVHKLGDLFGSSKQVDAYDLQLFSDPNLSLLLLTGPNTAQGRLRSAEHHPRGAQREGTHAREQVIVEHL